MALNPRKIRLPELPIFRKFSLALRQEFARAEDILEALDESRRQIAAMTDERGRRRPPSLRAGRPDLPERTETPAQGRADDQEEAPETFLKESVVRSLRSPAVERPAAREPAPPGSTRPMPVDRISTRGSSLPGDTGKAARGAKRPGRPAKSGASKPKRPPSKARTAKRSGQNTPASRRTSKNHPATGSGGAADEEQASVPEQNSDVEQSPLGQGQAAGPAAESAGQKSESDGSRGTEAGDDEDPDFWGEDRWRKGRKGKARTEKGRPQRLGIVRIGAEGRPVGGDEGAADEGE